MGSVERSTGAVMEAPFGTVAYYEIVQAPAPGAGGLLGVPAPSGPRLVESEATEIALFPDGSVLFTAGREGGGLVTLLLPSSRIYQVKIGRTDDARE